MPFDKQRIRGLGLSALEHQAGVLAPLNDNGIHRRSVPMERRISLPCQPRLNRKPLPILVPDCVRQSHRACKQSRVGAEAPIDG